MNATAINPIATVAIGTNGTPPVAPSAPTRPENGHTGTKNGKGKNDEKQPIAINITADSTFSLFPQTASDFKRLDGDYDATVTLIQMIEKPRMETSSGKKSTGKAKAGTRKEKDKAKATRPAIQVLRLTFTLDNKRSDGMTYTIDRDLRPKRARDSKFGEFIAKLLPDQEKLNQFFNDYRPSYLLNQRCQLKIKESRRQGQSTFKILELLPAQAGQIHTYTGESGHTISGSIPGTPVAQPIAA